MLSQREHSEIKKNFQSVKISKKIKFQRFIKVQQR